MQVVLRVDASQQIGSGHVMRCLTLAAALRERGAQCHFICRSHPGNLVARIKEQGHRVTVLPGGPDGFLQVDDEVPHAAWLGCNWQEDARQSVAVIGDDQPDWLVVDHYALDARWEDMLRAHCRKLMVIDDLADRPHNCDLLLDQNLGRVEADYTGLLPAGAQLLIGPRYGLLRPEFAALRDVSLQRRLDPKLQHILVTMGGVDQPNATSLVLKALQNCELPVGCRVTVIMGEHAPWLQQVRTLADEMPYPCEVRSNIVDMARLMAESDLAIGAAGSTSWERCCLGLPSLLVVLAENQRAGAEALRRAGAADLLGEIDAIGRAIPDVLLRFAHPDVLSKVASAAAEVTDGAGCIRVSDVLAGDDHVLDSCTVRPMEHCDLDVVLAWRNQPDVRRFMYTSHEISAQEHLAWFERCIADSSRHLLIVEEAGSPLGFVQFHAVGHLVADWGYYAALDAAKGAGTKLGLAALTYGFEQLGFHKVCGQALAFNDRSIALHRKLGFREEGTLRDQHFDGQGYVSVHHFGMLRQELRMQRGS